VSFFLDTGDRSQSSLAFKRLWGRRVDVECIRLDEMLASGPTVNVIKMDIEGGELLALTGMEGIIRRADSPLTLFTEYHPSALRAAGGGGEQFLARLAQLGFEVRLINEERRALVPMEPQLRGSRTANLFCVRRRAP
jgi:hypothetical protein